MKYKGTGRYSGLPLFLCRYFRAGFMGVDFMRAAAAAKNNINLLANPEKHGIIILVWFALYFVRCHHAIIRQSA